MNKHTTGALHSYNSTNKYLTVPYILGIYTLPMRKSKALKHSRGVETKGIKILAGPSKELPYGTYARKLLWHVCTEANKRKKEKSKQTKIVIGKSISHICRNILHMHSENLSGAAIKEVRQQLINLFTSAFYIHDEKSLNNEVFLLWKDFDLKSLTIEITDEFWTFLENKASRNVKVEQAYLTKLEGTLSPIMMDLTFYSVYYGYVSQNKKNKIIRTPWEWFAKYSGSNSPLPMLKILIKRAYDKMKDKIFCFFYKFQKDHLTLSEISGETYIECVSSIFSRVE